MARCNSKFKHKKVRQKSPPNCLSEKQTPPTPGATCPAFPLEPILWKFKITWDSSLGQWTGDITMNSTLLAPTTQTGTTTFPANINGTDCTMTIAMDYNYDRPLCTDILHIDITTNMTIGNGVATHTGHSPAHAGWTWGPADCPPVNQNCRINAYGSSP